MSSTANWSLQNFAWIRESEMAAGLIAAGATLIGQADFSREANYYLALFQISIGFERVCKLICLGDYILDHSGSYPPKSFFKKQAHDLIKLTDRAREIERKRKVTGGWLIDPRSSPYSDVLSVLSEFAESSRYYNLNHLSTPTPSQSDPIQHWKDEVGGFILKNSYRTRGLKARIDTGSWVDHVMCSFFTPSGHSESGQSIASFAQQQQMLHEAEAIRRWSRAFVLCIARWLAIVFEAVANDLTYTYKFVALDLRGPFARFFNERTLFLSRKVWSIY